MNNTNAHAGLLRHGHSYKYDGGGAEKTAQKALFLKKLLKFCRLSVIILNLHILASYKDRTPYVHEEVKRMNKYEVVYIIDPAVEEEARKALIAKFNDLITGNGGSVDKVEEWGKRRLAYAIDYKTEGYYVLVNFQAEAELPKELERNLQISDSVIRYQVIKQLERKVGIKPRAVRPAPVAPAAEAPVEAPAEPAAETPAE